MREPFRSHQWGDARAVKVTILKELEMLATFGCKTDSSFKSQD